VSEAAALQYLVRRHGKAEHSVAVFAWRGAEMKQRVTWPQRGSYAGVRTWHTRGGDDYMGCAWSGGGGR
jgi:hypothetical protein